MTFNDMLKHDKNKDSANFLNSMNSKFLLPYITSRYRITSHCRTVIENIFSNSADNKISSGNTISTISDHYAQFFQTIKNTIQKMIKRPANITLKLLRKMLLKET